MAQYEQLITLYGTIIVEAESPEEARSKIQEETYKLFHKHDHLIQNGLILGNFEIESDVKKLLN